METNPGPQRPVPVVCNILCSNVRGLAWNLSDLTVASFQYDILLCSETFVSDIRHVSEVLVPGFGRPVLLRRGNMPQARGMAAYVRDGYGAYRQPKFECGCCEMLVFRVCGVRQNLYVYSLSRNLDLDDRIFDCLQASMAAVQAEDVHVSFLFVGDLNGNHQGWCVLRPRTVMELRPLTSQQSLVAISWLSAQSICRPKPNPYILSWLSAQSIRWCGTGGFEEQGQCFCIGLRCSIPTIFFYSFSLSLLYVYRLVLWGWGLRTDRVCITLSQPCSADLF